MKTTALILAAGQGTRMKSSLPKVLHPILGKPMLGYLIDVVSHLIDSKPVVVIGHGGQLIREVFSDSANFVIQEELLGTGHAVLQARHTIGSKADSVMVTYGDMPLLTEQTLSLLINAKTDDSAPIVLLTVRMDQSHGFGRIVRDAQGKVSMIVEELDATSEQMKINEFNAGVYLFQNDWLWKNLPKVPVSAKGEYYLTDLVDIAVKQGKEIKTILASNYHEVIGVNNRIHLAEATEIIRERINKHWMLEGVTIVDPKSTFIEPSVEIGRDTTVLPNTYLKGKTVIGENCLIGPNSIIQDTKIGNKCVVRLSVLEQATLEDEVDVGPFGHLRKGAYLAKGVHMGNFGEVKQSYLGAGTKMGHFSYIGNAKIGTNVNIGAGTITCNYDGERKNNTEIEDDVFIGSDTMLVAPVKLGRGARTGAGSVVTKDILEYTLAVGVPARAIKKLKTDREKELK